MVRRDAEYDSKLARLWDACERLLRRNTWRPAQRAIWKLEDENNALRAELQEARREARNAEAALAAAKRSNTDG